jgi:hypothetical protein
VLVVDGFGRLFSTHVIDSFAPGVAVVNPAVDLSAPPACAQLLYFFACGDTEYTSPGWVTFVVSHVPTTASPFGAMMSADKKYAGNFTPAESIDESAFTAHAFATRKSFLISPPANAGIRSDANWRHALGAVAGALLHDAPRNVTSASDPMRPPSVTVRASVDRFPKKALPMCLVSVER